MKLYHTSLLQKSQSKCCNVSSGWLTHLPLQLPLLLLPHLLLQHLFCLFLAKSDLFVCCTSAREHGTEDACRTEKFSARAFFIS